MFHENFKKIYDPEVLKGGGRGPSSWHPRVKKHKKALKNTKKTLKNNMKYLTLFMKIKKTRGTHALAHAQIFIDFHGLLLIFQCFLWIL